MNVLKEMVEKCYNVKKEEDKIPQKAKLMLTVGSHYQLTQKRQREKEIWIKEREGQQLKSSKKKEWLEKTTNGMELHLMEQEER